MSSERPPESVLTYRNQKKVGKAVRVLILLCIVIVVVFPLYWMVRSSLIPRNEIRSSPIPLIPRTLSFAHYQELLFSTQSNFIQYYSNSILVAIGVVFLTTLTATVGGYGLARVDIPQKRIFARGVLFGYMFPSILLAIPMFVFWRELGILNSLIGLILAETALALPFSIWLMWKFFQGVPYSLEESARMAGASRFQAFVEIAFPVAKPGIIAVAIFSYAIAWNEYTIPKVLLIDSSLWPLTVGLDTLVRQNLVMWGEIMAASSLVILPSFLFVYFLQKHILLGFRF